MFRSMVVRTHSPHRHDDHDDHDRRYDDVVDDDRYDDHYDPFGASVTAADLTRSA